MTTQNLLISSNGTVATYTFPRDNQWSYFEIASFSFTLDEDIGDWDSSEKTYVYVEAGNYSPSVVLSSAVGDGYTVSADFMSEVGEYARCNPGYTFRIRFGRNDRPAVIESAYIVYNGVEKSYKWLTYNGKKLYKQDDLVLDETVTASTVGERYVTASDYIQHILGHTDWSITSEYVLVTLPENYNSDVDYYTGEMHPLYVYT